MNDETTTETTQAPQPLTEMQQLAATIAATANENVELKNQITQLGAKIKLLEEQLHNSRRNDDVKERELQSLHAMLDVLPGAAPRVAETKESYPSTFTLPVQARFMCWLASQIRK